MLSRPIRSVVFFFLVESADQIRRFFLVAADQIRRFFFVESADQIRRFFFLVESADQIRRFFCCRPSDPSFFLVGRGAADQIRRFFFFFLVESADQIRRFGEGSSARAPNAVWERGQTVDLSQTVVWSCEQNLFADTPLYQRLGAPRRWCIRSGIWSGNQCGIFSPEAAGAKRDGAVNTAVSFRLEGSGFRGLGV